MKVTKEQLRKIIKEELISEGFLDRLRSKAYGKAIGMTTKSDKLSSKAAQLDFAAAAKDRVIKKVESLADEAENDMAKMGIGSEDPELFDELNNLVKMLRDAAQEMRR